MRHADYTEFSSDFHHHAVVESAEGRLPLDGMIELTRLCTLKCTHCYIGDARWVKDPRELSTAQHRELLDALAERGTLWLCFTGGEPTARPDFKELWSYARRKGFVLSLFTNATLLTEELCEFLKAHPPLTVEVSIYGATERTYEAVTLVAGSHRRFLRGVTALAASGLPWKLKTVVLRENAHELDEMRAFAARWGVPLKFDANINASIGAGKTGGTAPCAARVDNETAVATELASPALVAEAKADLASLGRAGRPERLFSCGAGENNFYIDSTGLLQMCLLTPHRGHALAGDGPISAALEEGWDSFARARETKRRPDSPCRTCDLAALCENCPGTARVETGDEHAAVDWLCRNTHLKAVALNLAHRCDITHFVYSPSSPPENRSCNPRHPGPSVPTPPQR